MMNLNKVDKLEGMIEGAMKFVKAFDFVPTKAEAQRLIDLWTKYEPNMTLKPMKNGKTTFQISNENHVKHKSTLSFL